MHILVLSQYFWPESFRINEVVRSLTERGLTVDVLTAKPNYPDGAVFPPYRAWGWMQERWHGARIFRLPIFPRGKKSGLRLAINYLSFVISGLLLGPWLLRSSRPDVIFVYAPSPLLQALPAVFMGKLRGIPVAIHVQDLWPESINATGYVRNRLVIGMVDQLVGFIYRHADLLLVSSRPFEQAMHRFRLRTPVAYLPNSVDATFCDPESGIKPELPALDEGFTVTFAGNVGSAQAVEVIVKAARILRPNAGIRIVILGSGNMLDWMNEQKDQLGLDNLFLAGRFPTEAMPWLLSKSGALLVTLADQPIFAATVPNKIQAYMAVGRPIIASMNGEGARLVVEAGAGIAVPAEDGEALADAILRIAGLSPQERDVMADNARKYYQSNFNHDQLIRQLIEHLGSLMESKL